MQEALRYSTHHMKLDTLIEVILDYHSQNKEGEGLSDKSRQNYSKEISENPTQARLSSLPLPACNTNSYLG